MPTKTGSILLKYIDGTEKERERKEQNFGVNGSEFYEELSRQKNHEKKLFLNEDRFFVTWLKQYASARMAVGIIKLS